MSINSTKRVMCRENENHRLMIISETIRAAMHRRRCYQGLTAAKSVSKYRRALLMGFISSATISSNLCEFILHRCSLRDKNWSLEIASSHWKHYWLILKCVADGMQHNYKVLLPQWRETFCQRHLFNFGKLYCKTNLFYFYNHVNTRKYLCCSM